MLSNARKLSETKKTKNYNRILNFPIPRPEVVLDLITTKRMRHYIVVCTIGVLRTYFKFLFKLEY